MWRVISIEEEVHIRLRNPIWQKMWNIFQMVSACWISAKKRY